VRRDYADGGVIFRYSAILISFFPNQNLPCSLMAAFGTATIAVEI
jgi:hypothetical protein